MTLAFRSSLRGEKDCTEKRVNLHVQKEAESGRAPEKENGGALAKRVVAFLLQ
jgi:hypothetical protein